MTAFWPVRGNKQVSVSLAAACMRDNLGSFELKPEDGAARRVGFEIATRDLGVSGPDI